MMRKKKSQMLPIIQAVLCSHKTFTFSNSLVIIHSQAKLFLTVPWLKTDTFSVVLSLQTHLLAFADWMLDFLRPHWQYMFFRKKKLSRVSRVPFIGKDFPCFVILGPSCLKGAWLSGALELDRCAGCFLRESQGREYTGARRQKLSKYWSLMYQTMFAHNESICHFDHVWRKPYVSISNRWN